MQKNQSLLLRTIQAICLTAEASGIVFLAFGAGFTASNVSAATTIDVSVQILDLPYRSCGCSLFV